MDWHTRQIPFIALAFLLFVAFLPMACQFDTSREEAAQAFAKAAESKQDDRKQIEPKQGKVVSKANKGIPWEEDFARWTPEGQKESLPLRYFVTGKKDGPILLFVHGSPGGWGAWLDYLKEAHLRARFALLALDRPGYGGSAKGLAFGSLKKQAQALHSLLSNYQKRYPYSGRGKRPVVLAGHSLGGPIALRFALDYPRELSGLVLLASPANPNLEEWAWFNRLAEYRVVRFFLPQDWDTSNQELKPLKQELQKMEDRYKKIRCPVLLIHGTKDGLVPFANAPYLRDRLQGVSHLIYETPKSDHFLVWTLRPLVTQKILEFADLLETAKGPFS